MSLEQLIIPAIIAGTVILLFISLIWLISKKFQTCEMDEAIVRTGYGGPKVVISGAIFVFKLFHRMQRVSLRTIKLDVQRSGTGGDIIRSSDMLPIRINAEIYVRVPPKKEFIMAAARTLGESIDPKQRTGADTQEKANAALRELTFEKIQSAMRGVCAQMSLTQLHANHITVVDQITSILESDLQENGLELETVAIESFDPEPISRIQDAAESGNVFDITAARAATDIYERERTERNRIEKDAEIARKTQDTNYLKETYALEEDRVTADKTTEREIANIEVKTLAQIAMFEAETHKERTETVEQSNLDANKKIESSAMELEIYQSECEKDKAVTSAKYEKEYHTEELERDRAIEMLEEEVNESIAAAAIDRVQSIGTKASESKKVVGLAQLGTEKEIEVATVAKDESREVREEEKGVAVATARTEVARVETLTNEALAQAAKAEESIATVRIEQEQHRELVVPAEKRKLERITQAEGQKAAAVLSAEGRLVEAQRQRDSDAARGEGANALLALGRAEAETRRLKAEAAVIEAEAELLDSESVVRFLVSKNLPELMKNVPLAVEAAFKPLENIDGMKIIQVNSDGGNGENGGNAMGKLMKNAVQAVPLGAIVNELLSGAEGEQWADLLQNAVGALGQFGKSEFSSVVSDMESREITSTTDS